MLSSNKNSEAQQCANTNWASMSVISEKTNMNIVAKSDLNFQGKALVPVSNITGTWLTSSDLANALQYSNSRAVTMIYNKYADEFTNGMTQVLEVSTSGNYRKKVRVFSLRGAHLIAMFARTPVAKEFRRWVLDILDREIEHSPIMKQFTDDELLTLCYLQFWMEKSQRVSERLYPVMKQAKSEYAGALKEVAHDIRYMTEQSKEILLREVQRMDDTNFSVKRAMPILDELRGEGWIH